MAHGTLIGGTAYGIGGGKTLVDGTSYSIKNGKVLIDGTVYNIPFGDAGSADLWNGTSTLCEINCITYANGYWVVGGRYFDGTTSYARIAYTNDLNGSWTVQDVWADTKNNTNSSSIHCITYANGYWVVGGQWYGTWNGYTYYTARIAYSTSLTSTWTVKNFAGNNASRCCVYCVTYADGYWLAGTGENGLTLGAVYRCENTKPSGSWTTLMQWMGDDYGSTLINCITYANGYWVVGGSYSMGGYCSPKVSYTTSLANTWTLKDVRSSIGTSSMRMITGITYSNGYWVVCGEYNDRAYIAYSTSLGGTWTARDIFYELNSLDRGVFMGIVYANSKWVLSGQYYSNSDKKYYARIAHTDTLSGTWTMQDLWSGTDKNILTCVAFGNEHFMTAGRYFDGTTYYGRIAYTDDLTNFSVE